MIFNFDDCNSYLKDYLKRLPKRGFGESKKMAEYLGVSTTYMSQILSERRTLTMDQAHALSHYLGLNALEHEYFMTLAQRERAGTHDYKRFCEQKLQELKQKSLNLADRIESQKKLSEEGKSIFFSSAIYSMVHIYCATHKSGRSLEEINQRFELTRASSNEIMQFLLSTGLCSENDGRFQTTNQGIHLEKRSSHLLKHHTNWRLRAIQVAEKLRDDELMYTVNVALSEKDFAKLREKMVLFIQEFLEQVHPSPSEEIANLNLDWFWIRK